MSSLLQSCLATQTVFGFRCSLEYTVRWAYSMEYNSFTSTTWGSCCGFVIPSLLRKTQNSVIGFVHWTAVPRVPVQIVGSLSGAAAAAATDARLCDVALFFSYLRLEGNFGLNLRSNSPKKKTSWTADTEWRQYDPSKDGSYWHNDPTADPTKQLPNQQTNYWPNDPTTDPTKQLPNQQINYWPNDPTTDPTKQLPNQQINYWPNDPAIDPTTQLLTQRPSDISKRQLTADSRCTSWTANVTLSVADPVHWGF
jgi:hypothetical protein